MPKIVAIGNKHYTFLLAISTVIGNSSKAPRLFVISRKITRSTPNFSSKPLAFKVSTHQSSVGPKRFHWKSSCQLDEIAMMINPPGLTMSKDDWSTMLGCSVLSSTFILRTKSNPPLSSTVLKGIYYAFA